MDPPFFHALGASLLERTICASAGAEALNVTYGTRMGPDPQDITGAKLIILWGTNTLTANPHLWPFVREAKANGARTICIDPLRTRTAAVCDEHIPIRPGTDAALALSMMHVLFRDGLDNREYLEEMTNGWEQLRERALNDYAPERVAKICRIPVETIEHLAKRYGTTRPTFIRLNYGLQRHAGGGNAVRAISLLPAVTGAWDDVGGGALLSTSGTFSKLDTAGLQRRDLGPANLRTINMTRLGEALTEKDVHALVVYNSNPGAIAPDRENVLKGLRREDLFTVVLEHFQTDTADYADVLLPATTQLEHEDLHKAYGHTYVMFNARAIEPLGEALPNSEIFRRLAARMKLDDPALRESDEEMMRGILRNMPFTLDELRERSYIRLDIASPHRPFARGSRVPTPSGRIDIDSEVAAKAFGVDRVPEYVPPYESEERDPELVRRFPLALISPPAHSFLNSSFVNVPRCAAPRASRRWRFTRTTRSRAASPTARASRSSMIAARSRPRR
jgi:anaerobic selenocysteine-containing dehydrogenase